MDQEIARDCPLVDLVVGGHSHTLLYTGTPPDPKDVPSGPYPTVITQSSGKQVPVVQASAHSKYLGKLQLRVSIEELFFLHYFISQYKSNIFFMRPNTLV